MSDIELRRENEYIFSQPEIVKNSEDIEKAISIFASATEHRWGISSDVVRSWVISEFFAPGASVAVVRDISNQIIAGECVCPFDVVQEHMMSGEKDRVLRSVQALGFKDTARMVHLGGLGVQQEFEGKGIAQSLHKFLLDKARSFGSTLVLGQTYKPREGIEEDDKFQYSWQRNMQHGWQHLCDVDGDSYGQKVWVYISLT